MNNSQNPAEPFEPQLLEGEVLQVQEMARICGVSHDWLQTRIQQEVIHATQKNGCYYLCSTSIVRIQQVFQIERTYDADPQLAALVADLTEEVRRLRQELQMHSVTGP